jgi:Protein of unknown function (DUF4238)
LALRVTAKLIAMSAQVPIDHHFLPVFYQKAWAGPDGRVVRYSRPHDAVVARSNAPRATASVPHLYTMTNLPPARQAALETDLFGPVDARAAIAHRVLLSGATKDLTAEQRVDWARFLMATRLRDPFGLAEVKDLARHTLNRTWVEGDAEYEALRRQPDDPPTMYAWAEEHMPEVIENAHKAMLPALVDHEKLGGHLINMRWAIADVSSAQHTLLTSDRAFVQTHGWKHADTVLLFPLSPRRLFVAANGNPQIAAVMDKTPNFLVRWMNNEVCRLAVQIVIGTSASQLAFVERRLRRRDQEPIPGLVGKGRPNCPT